MSLHTADVWVGSCRVATLRTLPNGSTEFAYTSDTITKGGPQVAFSLPVTAHPVITPNGALPTFFSNLLPEGRRLSSLKRNAKVSLDDELGLLLEVGSATIGDVSVVAHGSTPLPHEAQLNLDEELDFSTVLTSAGITDPAAIPGIQDKASARTIATPVAGDFILKVSPPEYPKLVENEAACFNIARTLRRQIPASTTRVIYDRHGRSGLLVTRFDRPTPLHVEDAAQLLNLPPAMKYAPTMESVASAVAGVCASPALALHRVAYMTALAWLTGNGDMHAKNVSVAASPRGFEVAPLYDIPCTVAYGDSFMALSVAGVKDNLSAQKFQEFMNTIGLPARASETIIKRSLRATADAAERIIAAIQADSRQARDIRRVLSRRRRLWED